MDEELLDEIFADLAADLVDLSDDEIKDRILKYGLSPEDMQDVYDTVKAVQEAEAIGDKNLDPLSLDKVDALADANTKEAKRLLRFYAGILEVRKNLTTLLRLKISHMRHQN